MKRRLLSGLLVLCMVFTMLPTAAFAEDTTAGGDASKIAFWITLLLVFSGALIALATSGKHKNRTNANYQENDK